MVGHVVGAHNGAGVVAALLQNFHAGIGKAIHHFFGLGKTFAAVHQRGGAHQVVDAVQAAVPLLHGTQQGFGTFCCGVIAIFQRKICANAATVQRFIGVDIFRPVAGNIHNAVNFPDGNQRFVMRKADRLAQGVIRHSHVLCPPLTAYFNNGVHADRHIAR